MKLQITYQSKDYSPDLVLKRYVRKHARNEYRFCEVGENERFDLRQGIVKAKDIPTEIREQADALVDRWPSYVEWPLV